MNNKYFILIVFNFIFSQVFTDISFVGSRSIGTAGTIVSNPKSSECVFYNPAGLVKSEQISFLIGHNDLYNLSFMNHNYLSIVLPSKNILEVFLVVFLYHIKTYKHLMVKIHQLLVLLLKIYQEKLLLR